jgi:hypothetical protein
MNDTTIKYLNDKYGKEGSRSDKCLKFFELTKSTFNPTNLHKKYFEKCKLYHPDIVSNKLNPNFTDTLFKISSDVNNYLSDLLFDLTESNNNNNNVDLKRKNKPRNSIFTSLANCPKSKKYLDEGDLIDLERDDDDDDDDEGDDKKKKKKKKVKVEEEDDDDDDDEEEGKGRVGKIRYILKDLDRHSIQTFFNEHTSLFNNIKNDPLIDCICSQRHNSTRKTRRNPTISVKKEVDVSILYSLLPSAPHTFQISINRQDIRYTSGTSITFNNFVMTIIFPSFIRAHPPYFLILKQRGHQNVNSEDESDFYAGESPSSETIDLTKSTVISTNLFVVDPPSCPHFLSSKSSIPFNQKCTDCVSRHDVFVAIVPKLPPYYKYDLSNKILSCEITTNNSDPVSIQDILDPSIVYKISKTCVLKNKGLLSMANPSKRLDLQVTFIKTNDTHKASNDDLIKKLFS